MRISALQWLIVIFILIGVYGNLPACADAHNDDSMLLLREGVVAESNPRYQSLVKASGNLNLLEREKVLFLIKQIELSRYQFERNGTVYSSRQAAAHLRRKYLSGRFRINSAHEFINIIASGSSKTGMPYYIIDDKNRKFLSRDVLSKELELLENHLNTKQSAKNSNGAP